MTSREIARRRMHNQHIWGAPLKTPEEVVSWLVALQAQEFSVAKWSVAQRAKAVNDTDMDRAFANGAILRTHLLRPTWHFILPDDIRWLLDLTAPRVHMLNASMHRKLELDDRVFAKSNSLLRRWLKGGRHLTRKEIAERLERARISASGLRLGYILMRAELNAVVCSGAPRGKQQTYAAFDERVPQTKPVDRDESLAELMRRYFTSRGPATLKDFLRWSSLTASDGKAGLEIVGPELEREVVDGRAYWSAGFLRGKRPVAPRVDLVQGYDECIMSYSESKDVLFGLLTDPPDPAERTVLLHAILLDGRLIGHWKPVRAKVSMTVVTAPYRRLSREESRALDAAIDRFGLFVGAPTTVA
jgi:winged helix DNA-binding protein